MTAPVTDLAARINGVVTTDNKIVTNHGVVYPSPLFGQVRLDRHGLPTLVLGQWWDVDGVEAAYWGAVA
jgi:hypothetical protein